MRSSWFMAADIDLDHLVVFVRFLHCEVAPHPLPFPYYTYSLEGSHWVQPTPNEWDVMFTLLQGEHN